MYTRIKRERGTRSGPSGALNRRASAVLTVESVKHIQGFSDLYLASRPHDSSCRVEFIDAVDPPATKQEKWVITISSQFGCVVGCTMCDAGTVPYKGNLTVQELLWQIRTVIAANPDVRPAQVPKIKLHFARMGDPSLNPAVAECLDHLGKEGLLPGLLPSLSTVAPQCGVSHKNLLKWMDHKNSYFTGGRFQLQFSIHSTDEGYRKVHIPVKKWRMTDIAEFGKLWFRPGDRKITLNFALADAAPFDPQVLAGIFSPERFLVKFTPVHPSNRADSAGLTKRWVETPSRLLGLSAELERLGFSVIVNPTWPEEVQGKVSCGQLAAIVEEPKAVPVA